jgi:hypothetical protein
VPQAGKSLASLSSFLFSLFSHTFLLILFFQDLTPVVERLSGGGEVALGLRGRQPHLTNFFNPLLASGCWLPAARRNPQ